MRRLFDRFAVQTLSVADLPHLGSDRWRIAARHVESRDAVTLWLQPNRHWDGFRQHLDASAMALEPRA